MNVITGRGCGQILINSHERAQRTVSTTLLSHEFLTLRRRGETSRCSYVLRRVGVRETLSIPRPDLGRGRFCRSPHFS